MKTSNHPRHYLPRTESKPKVVKLKIVRNCLGHGCGKTFVADSRFLRLCPMCRSRA